MNTLARALTGLVIGLALVGCGSIPSEFDYAGDAATAVKVVMPYPVRITSVNGRAVSLPPVIDYPYTVSVDAGPTTMGFQYSEPWGVGDDSELVRGPVMEVAFAAEPGAQYAIDFNPPADVRDERKADDYVAGFSAWLRDAAGQRRDAVSTGRAGGVTIDLAGSLSGNQPAAEPADTVVVAPTAAEPETAPRLESLKQLWQQANAEERQAFMQWVVAPGN